VALVMPSLTRQLAEFAADLRYEDLPPDVVRLAKDLTLDTLGTTLAGITLGAGCAPVSAVMSHLGGPAQSSIFGVPGKVAAPNAAFANGALAHALNFDAVGEETGHTGVACFAAPFALAEADGGINGKRFLTAVIVAAEVTARVTRAARRGGGTVSKRVLSGQWFSYFGAAAGAAHVLGLDPARTHCALGLALMQLAGSRQVVIGGDPPAKAIYGAFPAQAGVQAALLAQAGLGAEIAALEGEAGVFGLVSGGAFDTESLTAELGRTFACSEVQFKPWATSNHVTPFIEATMEVRTAARLGPDDIARVILIGSPEIRDWFEPLNERRRPSNAAAAANSALFAVAHVLAHGDVGLGAFTDAGMSDRLVGELADRIDYELADIAGARVRILTHDGRSLEAATAQLLGSASRPLGRERLQAKFLDCATHAPGVTSATAQRLIAFVEDCEAQSDVGGLARLANAGLAPMRR
jgi:2-methylcitrate dehydratase PrpD